MSERTAGAAIERRLLLAALGCGLAHYYLFFGKSWGISYPLFVLQFYVYFYWALQEKRVLAVSKPNLLLIPVLLLSLTYFLFTNMLFYLLNAVAVPLLVVLHTTWAVHADALRNRASGIVMLTMEQLFVHTVRYVPRPVIALFRSVTGRMHAGRTRELAKVLLGLLLSVPLLFVIVHLLASADSMFDRTLSRFPQLFEHIKVGPALLRVSWIAAITSALFAYVWGLKYPKPFQHHAKREDEAAEWEPPALPAAPLPRMDATVAVTMLFMLNAVYLLFAVVQFSYFFGGGTADLPDGTTYAQYARRGFAELVVVTLINLTVLMGTLYGVRRPGAVAWILLRSLLAVMVGFTGIMLSSAYLRLSMYEQAYGYTVTRVLVHAIMIFLLVLFVLALFKLWKEKIPLFRYYCIAAVAAYVILNYANIDAIIARNNMARYETTGKVDTRYLSSLSVEAVPHLLEWRRKHPDLPGLDEAIRTMGSRLPDRGETAWTEFNWSEWRAAKALQAVD